MPDNETLMIGEIFTKINLAKTKKEKKDVLEQYKKITVLTSKMQENLYLGSRNIKNISVIPAQSASAYDLLDCQLILADEASVEVLNEQLSK